MLELTLSTNERDFMGTNKKSGVNKTEVISIMIVLIFCATGCKPIEKPKENEIKVVTTKEVNTFTGFESQKFPAVLVRDQEITLSFRVPGIISKLPWHIGDRVNKNQLLASIEADNYEANLKKIETELDISKRALVRNNKLLEAGGIPAKEVQDRIDNHESLLSTYDSIKYDLNSTTKISQVDGIIISKYVEVGETVQPGQPILKMADKNSQLIAKISVPSRFKRRIKNGQMAEISISGMEKLVTGRVKRIGSYSSTSTGNVSIDVNLPSDIDIPSGTIAIASFNWQKEERSIMVSIPPESVLSIKNEKIDLYVMDRDSSKAIKKEVKFIKFDDEKVIVTGLEPGERVITVGSGFIKDGEKVREVLL